MTSLPPIIGAVVRMIDDYQVLRGQITLGTRVIIANSFGATCGAAHWFRANLSLQEATHVHRREQASPNTRMTRPVSVNNHPVFAE
jgi:hypothetical protein